MKNLILLLIAGAALFAQLPAPGGGSGGVGVGASNVSATCSGATTSCAVTVTSLGLTTIDPALMQCKTATAPVVITSYTTAGSAPITTVTPSYASTTGVTCTVNSNGGQGATGATGATGSAGAAATVAAGSTTTGAAGTSASVANAGSSSAAVFNFTIPRGDTGAAGANGTNGTNGSNGATGATGAAGTNGTNGINATLTQTSSDPSGACTVPAFHLNLATGFFFACTSTNGTSTGTWARQPQFSQGTAAPTTCTVAGAIYVRTTNGAVYACDGTNYVQVVGTGDIIGPASALDNEVAIYNSTTGKLLKRGTGCTINTTTAIMTCTGGFSSGDGTKTSKIDFQELAANGSNLTSIYGPDSLSADSCYVMPTAVSTSGQALADSGSTTVTTETVPRTCRQLVWSSNIATATALAANGANCSAGQFPLGVDASGASETCTALPTTIAGTANEVTASASTGPVTLSLAATLDFSAKTSTKTHKTGTTLPGTCAVGESFQDTDATATSQWYLCTATNTWTAQGGGGGSSTWTYATRFVHRDAGAMYSDVTTNGTLSSGGAAPNPHHHVEFPDETAGTEIIVTVPLVGFTPGPINIKVQAVQLATSTASYGASAGCVSIGGTYNSVTYNTEVTVSKAFTNGLLAEIVLNSVATTGCANGDVLHMRLRRPTGDASTDIVYNRSMTASQ